MEKPKSAIKYSIYDLDLLILRDGIEKIQDQNRIQYRLDGWFYGQEIRMRKLQQIRKEGKTYSRPVLQAMLLKSVLDEMPISIREGEIFAGTQADAFSRTYALINPSFRVETFEGYCDPMAVYNDITPDVKSKLTADRINRVREFWAKEEFVQELSKVYQKTGLETKEVAYFIEQVTGHTIADFRPVLKSGIQNLVRQIENKRRKTKSKDKQDYYYAMLITLQATLTLARRYATLAGELAQKSVGPRQQTLNLIARTCKEIPYRGAQNLYEAIQSYILLWMVMAIEQTPNPYAFSVGNIDRVLQPYYTKEGKRRNRDFAVEMVRHFLTLFNVGDRNWAISQNIILSGKDEKNRDLTCDMTGIVLDAFYASNYPQPIVSVKLHKNSTDEVYSYITKFLLSPGHSTPSLFNDDLLFKVLRKKGIAENDLKDYSIAGCQEPLIMGKESANTTNTWLNLAKILELTLNNGVSAISGKPVGLNYEQLGLNPANPFTSVEDVKSGFYKQLDYLVSRMVDAGNGCTRALSLLPVPFLSIFMGGINSGLDMRDVIAQGTKYNGSGCLIHGMANVADSFTAIKYLFEKKFCPVSDLLTGLRKNFDDGYTELRDFLLSAPKYGNDNDEADTEARELVTKVSTLINRQKNPWGNGFTADWSTPSTHLLYGYWVGATPDGRKAREMLNYGLDPYIGYATKGLPPRIMSQHKLPYNLMLGGHASHIGINAPGLKNRINETPEQVLRKHYIDPVFGFTNHGKASFYVYYNVDTADHLREILTHPQKYCPNGIYIMRIHGTFVNFLDLSPAIQEDIIKRLDPESTKI